MPDSTAEIACRDTPAMSATCCWENPRACRASRSRAPFPAGCPSLTLALPASSALIATGAWYRSRLAVGQRRRSRRRPGRAPRPARAKRELLRMAVVPASGTLGFNEGKQRLTGSVDMEQPQRRRNGPSRGTLTADRSAMWRIVSSLECIGHAGARRATSRTQAGPRYRAYPRPSRSHVAGHVRHFLWQPYLTRRRTRRDQTGPSPPASTTPSPPRRGSAASPGHAGARRSVPRPAASAARGRHRVAPRA